MTNKKTPENAIEFICDGCSFKCYKSSDFNRHLLTAKHKRLTNAKEKAPKNAVIFGCNCGKTYRHSSSLIKHNKICSLNANSITKGDKNDSNLTNNNLLSLGSNIHLFISQNKEIMDALILQNEELIKKNNELTNTIIELIPKIGNNNTTNNTTNNNQFNLQVFLNEDCKDAMNFSDFIKQIQVSLTDLENQAENGYIKGITRLFVDNLQGLGMNNRPIHCTDKKRRTLYIKENNEWDKEGSQDILKKGIQEVTRRTFEQLIKEQEIHSDEYDDADSEFSMKCISIQRNLTPNHPRESTISKVIDNITKNTEIL
jgi:hypothetical protein